MGYYYYYYYYYKKATTEGQFMYIYTQFTIHRYYITKKKSHKSREIAQLVRY